MARTSQKLPALPWYPKDFIADEHVIAMNLEAEGAYRRLLDHQWLHGSVPADLRLLAGICKGIPVARMRKLWLQIGALFLPVPDDVTRLQNAKLERVRQEREAFIEGKKAAGQLGGIARSKRLAERRQTGSSATSMPVANGKPASASASASATTTADAEVTASSESASGGPVSLDPVIRCTVAANTGLRDNIAIGRRFNELVSSNQSAVVGGWLLEGVDPELAAKVVYDRALNYVPKGRNTQPRSLSYFTSAVIEAQERERDRKAQEAAAAEIAEGERHKQLASRSRPSVPTDGLKPDQVPSMAKLLGDVAPDLVPGNTVPTDHPPTPAEKAAGFKRAAEDQRRHAQGVS